MSLCHWWLIPTVLYYVSAILYNSHGASYCRPAGNWFRCRETSDTLRFLNTHRIVLNNPHGALHFHSSSSSRAPNSFSYNLWQFPVSMRRIISLQRGGWMNAAESLLGLINYFRRMERQHRVKGRAFSQVWRWPWRRQYTLCFLSTAQPWRFCLTFALSHQQWASNLLEHIWYCPQEHVQRVTYKTYRYYILL